MHFGRHIWYRWTFCTLLLCIQLSAGVVSAWAFQHTPSGGLDASLEELLDRHHLPPHVEHISEGDLLFEKIQTKCPTRYKLRYYVSRYSQQHNLSAPLSVVLSYNSWKYLPVPEKKTGEYSLVRAFLPGYYQFLFRQTPF